jgi:hypothetical protein
MTIQVQLLFLHFTLLLYVNLLDEICVVLVFRSPTHLRDEEPMEVDDPVHQRSTLDHNESSSDGGGGQTSGEERVQECTTGGDDDRPPACKRSREQAEFSSSATSSVGDSAALNYSPISVQPGPSGLPSAVLGVGSQEVAEEDDEEDEDSSDSHLDSAFPSLDSSQWVKAVILSWEERQNPPTALPAVEGAASGDARTSPADNPATARWSRCLPFLCGSRQNAT